MDFYRLEDYDYELPEDLIAQQAVEPRDASRLLVIDRKNQTLEHRQFSDLHEYLKKGDLIVANNTRVMAARLLGHRILPGAVPGQFEKGGKVEFLMLEKQGELTWEGMFHAAAKHRPGVMFEIPTPEGTPLRGEIIRGANESTVGTIWVKFNRDPLTSGVGQIPLPPYIERAPEDHDLSRYQTEYAKELGSAAAPTAGLHFTRSLIQKLCDQGVAWREITLHVGLGTFRPVKDQDIRKHEMHEESFHLSAEVAQAVRRVKESDHAVTAVGTTTVRALESAQWVEAKLGFQKTQAFFYPGHADFKIVDHLVTNFHLPKSTLLMLVCAFAGRDLVFRAYREAIERRYRFFSYGDAMLIL